MEMVHMIERLMDLERPCRDSAYIELSEQIVQLKQELSKHLDQEGKELLDRLSEAYLKQSGIMLKRAFSDGFCVTVGLTLDYLKHRGT